MNATHIKAPNGYRTNNNKKKNFTLHLTTDEEKWPKMFYMRYVECLEFEICDKWRIKKKKRQRRKIELKNIFYGYFVDTAEREKSEFLFASANFN